MSLIRRQSTGPVTRLVLSAGLMAGTLGGQPSTGRADEPVREPAPDGDGLAEGRATDEAAGSPGNRPPSQQELMTGRGFIRHRGAWRTAQEIELSERGEKFGIAQKQWGPRLEKLRRRLDDPATAATAAEELREIVDPAAVPALAAALAKEPVGQVRAFELESLARIGSADALGVVVQAAIDHADADTRLTAVERLQKIGPRVAEPVLVASLSGPDNARVNRAAEAIGALGLESAVVPLVDALETEHIVTTSDGRQSGQTSVTFGSGGDGLSLGGGPKRGKVRMRNESVLAALVQLTGQDFKWNIPAWKQWLAGREFPTTFDLRRGE